MASAGVEGFLNGFFMDSARQKELQQKGRVYQYELRRKYDGTSDASGKCIVLARRYDRSLDCDVLSCLDIKTKETFSCNQFQIELEEYV